MQHSWLILLLTFVSAAQASEIDSSTEKDLRPNLGSELLSPWTTGARPYLLVGAALTTALVLLEDQVVDPLQNDISKDRPIGKLSKLGDYGGQLIPNGLYVAGMLTHWLMTDDASSLRRAELMFKASLYACTLSTGLKYIVREPRPNDGSDKHSFPSGHSTAAFAFAGMVTAEHSLPYGTGALSLATLTALSRINDNRHFVHDVVAGATIGGTFGYGLSLLHKKAREDSAAQSRVSFQVVPFFQSGAKGAALVGEF